MARPFDDKLAFLRSHGAGGLAHSGQTFLDHLLGTRALLMAWKTSPEICDAGLFHAVYGTEMFTSVVVAPSDRRSVVEIIGERAERLAWLFCVMQREGFVREASRGTPAHIFNHATGEPVPVTPGEVSGLAHLVVANRLERLPRVAAPAERCELAAPLLDLRRHVGLPALKAVMAYARPGKLRRIVPRSLQWAWLRIRKEQPRSRATSE